MAKAKSNENLVYGLEEMIKKYNKKPEKKIKKRDIINTFQKTTIIMPVKCTISDGEVIGENIKDSRMKPDIVKNEQGVRLLPLFTSYEQIPRDYMEDFSLIKVPAVSAYSYMNYCDSIGGIVLNPFTEYNIEFRKKKGASSNSNHNAGGTTRNYEKTSRPARSVVENNKTAMIIYDNQKYIINKSPFVIGRESADIEIPKNYISKIHVVISFKDGKYRIADYDSTNGTKVNDSELRPKVYYELRDGYEIELGGEEKMLFYRN